MSLSLKGHYVIAAPPERSIRPLLFFNLSFFLSFICNLSSFNTLFMFSSLNDLHNHFICSFDSTANLQALFFFYCLRMCSRKWHKSTAAGVNKAGNIQLFLSAVLQWLISKQSLITTHPISKSVKS